MTYLRRLLPGIALITGMVLGFGYAAVKMIAAGPELPERQTCLTDGGLGRVLLTVGQQSNRILAAIAHSEERLAAGKPWIVVVAPANSSTK